MTDVEQLLRDTLTDPRRRLEPGADMFPAVLVAARHRQRTRAIVSAASCAVLLVVVGGVSAFSHRSTVRSVQPGLPGASVETRIDLGAADFHVGAVIATHNSAFVFVESTPTKVLQLNTTTGQVTRSADGPGANGGLAIDSNGRDLFAWSEDGAVQQYDAKTMAPADSAAHPLPPGTMVFEGAALSGQLWLTTDHGLFLVSFDGDAPRATQIAGVTNAYGLTADPARHRVLVGVFAGGDGLGTTQIVAVDGPTLALTRGGGLPFGKESIAVVGNDIWVGGYGDETTSRLVRLDTRTLQPTRSSSVNAALGPGAVVWAGQHVFWVRAGGSEELDCVDPTTGDSLQAWDAVQGPVSSVAGAAYGADSGVLQKLTLTQACEG